ncbi:MAG: hypothetical protein BWY82_02682 [Verrucomicrobia bacterium ADurb.Bin474]|nr:MAG: hypothetical protein BWY82_02682 [Verrucomicrobia bacterium ADurb.Bin474]
MRECFSPGFRGDLAQLNCIPGDTPFLDSCTCCNPLVRGFYTGGQFSIGEAGLGSCRTHATHDY